MIDPTRLLFIEPFDRSPEPIIDSLTRKITASLKKAKRGDCWMGSHMDVCGCRSSSCDQILPNGEITNSLAIHYVAFHRSSIPQEQLDKIEALSDGELEPTVKELWP